MIMASPAPEIASDSEEAPSYERITVTPTADTSWDDESGDKEAETVPAPPITLAPLPMTALQLQRRLL
jgi:hypothetical protein